MTILTEREGGLSVIMAKTTQLNMQKRSEIIGLNNMKVRKS